MFADALAAQAVPVTQVDWRPPLGDAGTEAAPGPGAGRPAARPGQRHRGRPDAVRRRRAGRRTAGVGGARPGPRRVPARRAADRLGPRVRPAARRADRRDALRGARRHAGGGRERAARRGDGVSLDPCHHHRTVGPMAGVVTPVDVDVRAARPGARRHRVVLAQRGPRQGAAVRRLRARGRRAAALDVRRARPAAADGGPRARERRRSTSRRSPPRCCRWATRGTTATGPGR